MRHESRGPRIRSVDPEEFSPTADPNGRRRRVPPGKKLKLTRAQVADLAEWLRKVRELGNRRTKAQEMGISKFTLEHYVARIKAGDLRGREDCQRRRRS